MKQNHLALALAALFSIAAAGCGGADQASSTSGAPASSSSSAAEQGSAAKSAPFDLAAAKDGTYTAESSKNEKRGLGKIELTIRDHKIVAATYTGIDRNGKIKTEDYGKQDGQIKDEQHYRKAQIAFKAHQAYADQLVERQSLEKVDAIAGATVVYDQFREAATKAVTEASK